MGRHTFARPFPSYLDLDPGEIHRRAVEAVRALADCRLCPRDCGADRLGDRWGACKTGRHAVVSSHFARAQDLASDLGLRRLDKGRPHPRLLLEMAGRR